jgi:hypothetical protein
MRDGGTCMCAQPPLIIKENCPGIFVRDLEIHAAWVLRIFSSTTDGLLDSWKTLLSVTENNAIGGVPIQAGEIHKQPLPQSLISSSLHPHYLPQLLPDLATRA